MKSYNDLCFVVVDDDGDDDDDDKGDYAGGDDRDNGDLSSSTLLTIYLHTYQPMFPVDSKPIAYHVDLRIRTTLT